MMPRALLSIGSILLVSHCCCAFVPTLINSPFVGSGISSVSLSESRLDAFQAQDRRSFRLATLKQADKNAIFMSDNILEKIIVRKQAEVNALKANTPAAVAERLEKMGTYKNKNLFLKAIKKPKGTSSVITQLKTKTPSVERICSVVEPALLGTHHYEAGASAISVCTDEEAYGFNYDILKQVVKGQDAYRGNFPGPLPVMAYDFFLDPIQLAQAAANGASAVCINACITKDKEKTKELIQAADKLGMDALVEVHNEAELDMALSAGATIVGISNRNQASFELETPVDFVTRELSVPLNQTVFHLISRVPSGVVPVAMGGINETLVAWSLRDAGYSGLLVGEAIMKGSETRMAGSAYQGAYNEAKGLIKAFKSKGSLKYGPSSTASFYGKGEGAKETLGMISI